MEERREGDEKCLLGTSCFVFNVSFPRFLLLSIILGDLNSSFQEFANVIMNYIYDIILYCLVISYK
jgi:hypothetical protein